MKNVRRIGMLMMALLLAPAVGGCAASDESEDVGDGEDAVVRLPSMNTAATVRYFNTDPAAKAALAKVVAEEARRAKYDGQIAVLKANIDAAKKALEAAKDAWKSDPSHTHKCHIFFHCTDYTDATDVHAK